MSIVINGLSKFFDKRKIFDNFSLELPTEGTVLIAGNSGVGKTTLLRIIAGLDKKYNGALIGVPDSISYAFQEHRLFSELTALENVALVFQDELSAEAVKKASEMLSKLGLTKDEQRLLPSELSGGMRQRVSLARAFVKDSKLLILDEPFKELDEALICTVAQIIDEKARDRLVLIVTHESSEKIINKSKTVYL